MNAQPRRAPRELLDRVRDELLAAGYGAESGVVMHEHAYGVIITWRAPSFGAVKDLQPSTDAYRRTVRGDSATAAALVAILRGAGLNAAAHPDGFILVHQTRYLGERTSGV